MKLSIWVSPAWRALDLNDRALYGHLKDCGFSRVCGELNAPAGKEEAEALLSAMKDAGVTLVKERTSVLGKDALIPIIESCARLHVTQLVIPLLSAENWKRDEYMEKNAAYLRSLAPVARENGVTLMIEHAGHFQNAHYTHSTHELLYLIDLTGEDGIMVNLNIGAIGLTDVDLYPEIRLLKGRIGAVDMNDNFFGMALGIDKWREDLALAPLMGFLDYDEVMRALTETGYDGDMNLLVNYPRVLPKESPYITKRKFTCFPLPLLKQFTLWMKHTCEFIIASYGAGLEEEA